MFNWIVQRVRSTQLTFKDILNDQVALRDHNEQRNMRPCKQTELLHVVFLDQRQHEPHETDAVQRERQEAMVFDEETQILDAIDDHTIVVDQIFAVEKVIGC